MAYTDQPAAGAALDPSPLPTPYSDRSPRLSEAGPSQPTQAPAPAAADTGLPRPSSPYAGAAAATPLAGAAAESPQDRSRLQRLRDADPHWLWKASLRAVLLVAAAIGLAGSAVLAADHAYWADSYGDEDLVPYALVPFTVSFIWCAIVLLVPLLSRRARPVHPGVVVAIDLVFWVGLIFALGITIIGYASFASDYTGSVRPVPMNDYSFRGYNDDGGYVQASNGTWVYTASIDEDDYANLAKATPTPADAAATAATAATAAVWATTTPATATATATITPITPAPVVRRATTASSEDGATASSDASYDSYDSYDPYTPYSTDGDAAYVPFDSLTTTLTRYVYSDGAFVTRTVVYSDGIPSTQTASSSSSSATGGRTCSHSFASCAAQDAYVNRLFHRIARDTPLALMAVVLLALLLLLHFVLFVWACVDTHRYNRRAALHAAFDLSGAGGIALIENLRQHGYVMVPAEAVQGTAYAAAAAAPVAGTAAEKAPAGGFGRFA